MVVCQDHSDCSNAFDRMKCSYNFRRQRGNIELIGMNGPKLKAMGVLRRTPGQCEYASWKWKKKLKMLLENN